MLNTFCSWFQFCWDVLLENTKQESSDSEVCRAGEMEANGISEHPVVSELVSKPLSAKLVHTPFLM